MEQDRIARDYIDAIAANYISMHCIDLKTNRIARIKSNPIIDMLEMQAGTEEAHKVLPFVMAHITEKRSVKDILEFVDLVGLRDRMREINSVSMEFLGNVNGWCRGRFTAVERDEDGDVVRVLWMVSLIEYEKKEQQRLLELSETDKLTGLGNRRAYDEALARIQRIGNVSSVSIAVMDVNGLKIVNDTLGHTTGDELIIGAAECIKEFCGQYGECFRIGGDEFCAVMTRPCPETGVFVERFKEIVAQWSHPTIDKLAVSVGMIRGEDYEYMPLEELIETADHRMYEDKEAYYVRNGLDRRGQQRAFAAICESYTKILLVNLVADSFEIIKMNRNEESDEWGYEDTYSEWLQSFVEKKLVAPEQTQEFLDQLSISNVRESIASGQKRVTVRYRRKMEEGGYHKVLTEVIPAKEYTKENPLVYLYVKDIE